MVIAHHIILTGYGHWLANDPRGSLSAELRTPELRKLGETHFGRKARQPPSEQIKAFYQAAEQYLKHPVVWFDHAKRQAIGLAFGRVVESEGLTCYACGVTRNHSHLVIRRHRLRAREMIRLLKEASWKGLIARGMISATHPLWSQDPYAAFKDTPQAVRSAIRYIQGNFRKHRLVPQHWSFVAPYDGWPFHRRRRGTIQ